MNDETDSPEFKADKRKAIALFVAGLALPAILVQVGEPAIAPYAFAGCMVTAVAYLMLAEVGRLSRRIDQKADR